MVPLAATVGDMEVGRISGTRVVRSAGELLDAVQSDAMEIVVQGTIAGIPMITLRPGVTLRNGTLTFGAKGVRLTRDNTLDGVTVETAEDEVAILNDTGVDDLGTLTLRNVRTIGQVLILADDRVGAGHVLVSVAVPSGRMASVWRPSRARSLYGIGKLMRIP